MGQAIDEGFIIDVLKYYTPVASYYRLEAAVETDPMFDRKRAQKKLRKYVERHDHAIRLKFEQFASRFVVRGRWPTCEPISNQRKGS